MQEHQHNVQASPSAESFNPYKESKNLFELKQELNVLTDKVCHRDSLISESLGFTKIIFSSVSALVALVAILIGILAGVSQINVNSSIERMERRFAELSGQALLKPSLEILYEGSKLDGANMMPSYDFNRGQYNLPPFQLKNSGGRAVESISATLYSSAEIHLMSSYWSKSVSDDKHYPYCYKLRYNINRHSDTSISPDELLDLDPLTGSFSTGVTKCKLRVFYRVEKPVEASFTIESNPKPIER